MGLSAVFELLERYLFFSETDHLASFEDWNRDHQNNFNVIDQKRTTAPYRSITGLKVNTLETVKIDSYYLGFEENHSAFTSIGCATHSDSMLALQGAISEQLENFIISEHLLKGIAPRKIIDPHQFFDDKNLLNHLESQGYQLMTLAFLESKFPAFLSFILKEDGGFPYLFYGVGCHPDVMKGIEKSIRESLMTWMLEAPQAEQLKQNRDQMDADLSKSPLYYEKDYCFQHFPEWLEAAEIDASEVLKSVDPGQTWPLPEN